MSEILHYLTEEFELAARLALTQAGSDWMTIRASLRGLGKRALIVGQHDRMEFTRPYGPAAESLERQVTLDREALVAEPRAHAVAMAREFLVRFGWNPSIEQLTEHQASLTG